MQCERCGESAATQRTGEYLCGRCALRIDWEDVARTAQGLGVREAVQAAVAAAAGPAPAGAMAPPAPPMPPADPFTA